MMAPAVSAIADPALLLAMPGCWVHEVNAPAWHHFDHRVDVHDRKRERPRLQEWRTGFRAHGSPACLCTLLGGPNAYLAEYCPFEVVYKTLRKRGVAPAQLYALRYTDAFSRRRVYDLYFVHAWLTGNKKEMGIRLLPLPSEMTVHVEDLEGTDPNSVISQLAEPLPFGIRVSVFPFIPKRDITVRALSKDGVFGHVEEAARFFHLVKHCLEHAHRPDKAWAHALRSFPAMRRRVPESVTKIFSRSSDSTYEEALRAIAELWRHPLDAPTFTSFVYPTVLRALRDDDGFRFAPTESAEDRDRYFKLHIPLRDLEDEDRCFGWLPLTDESRHVRTLLPENL